jgi:HK97 family phage major capsid protein
MAVDTIALRQKWGQKVERMEAVLQKSVAEDREPSEAEYQACKELQAEADALKRQIKLAEEIIALKAEGAKPIVVQGAGADEGRHRVFPEPKNPAHKGFDLVHMVKALAAARGNLRDAADFAERVLQNTGVAKALAAGTGSSGGFIVPEAYVADIIEFLRPASIVTALDPMILPMPGGNLTVPKLAGGSSAAYIGENTNLPNTLPQFGQIRLTARKLGAMVPISNDLIRFSTPSADTVVRDDLVRAIAQRQDLAFIRDAGTGNAPKGLRYWAPPSTNVLSANPTVNLQNVTDDLGSLVLAMKNQNVRFIKPGWMFSHRTEEFLFNLRDSLGNFAFRPEMLTGKLRTFPYKATTQIPNNLVDGTQSEVYLADFADVVIGDVGTIRIDASTEAAYFDGSAVQAAFSLDQTVVRAIVEHDIAMRHDFSVSVLTGVTWNP